MTKNIYILSGVINNEDSYIITAFNNQEDAELLAEKCRAHDKIAPTYPSTQVEVLAWINSHPSGNHYCSLWDYYEVEEVELK
jgi:hypothetical protein